MCIRYPFLRTLRRYRTVLKESVVKSIDQASNFFIRSLLFEVTTRNDTLDTISREELRNTILQNCVYSSIFLFVTYKLLSSLETSTFE